MFDEKSRDVVSKKYSPDGKFVLTIFKDKNTGNNPRLRDDNVSVIYISAPHLFDKDMFPDYKNTFNKLEQIKKASVMGFYLEYSMDKYDVTRLRGLLDLNEDIEFNRRFNFDQNQSSIVGAIYVTEKSIKEADCVGLSVDELKDQVDIELNNYNSWLNDEMYAFIIQDTDVEDDNVYDSLDWYGKFLGEEGIEQILKQVGAQDWLENEIEDEQYVR